MVVCDVYLVTRLTEVLAGVEDVLSADERVVADRFVRPADRLAYTAAHAALRAVLASRVAAPPGALALRRGRCPACGGPHGKPFLPGGPRFSFSRAAGAAVIALAGTEVGVDIEGRLGAEAAADVASAYAPSERAAVAVAGTGAGTEVATRLWVRKEAALKCLGVGLTVDLRSFDVLGETASIAGQAVHLVDVAPGDGDDPDCADLYIAVASQTERPLPVLHRWTLEDVGSRLTSPPVSSQPRAAR